VIVPQSDWEQLPGVDAGYLIGPDSLQVLTQPVPAAGEPTTRSGSGLRWTLRSGYEADLVAPTGGEAYTIGRLQYGDNVRGVVDWEHDGDGAECRRRTLIYDGHGLALQLGTVEPRWGRGLVVGRRSRFIGATSARRPDGTFLQPTRSRFNGLWLSSDEKRTVSGNIVISDIRSDQFTDRVAAAQLRVTRCWWRAGVTALTGIIERRDSLGAFTRQILGGHVRLGDTKRALLAEIAVDNGGATAKAVELLWPFARGRFHARAWSYGARFINPWGGGPAHSDRESVFLDSINEAYSTRTTGERGFALTTRLDASESVSLRWDWMTHKEAPDAPLIHHWTVRSRVQWRRLRVTPFARGKSVEGGNDLYSVGSYATLGDVENRIEARFEVGRHRTHAERFIRAGVGLRRRLNGHLRLAPTIRWVDPNLSQPRDGYWYIYFAETVIPGPFGRFEAVLVWQRYEDRARGDRVELRLRSLIRP
ncbi:MAG TPA: hypothetical protein VM118_03605, partial [Acidobacteriota bacterium]|nr:hypothetical protein [Acidobacteriota bacterium]